MGSALAGHWPRTSRAIARPWLGLRFPSVSSSGRGQSCLVGSCWVFGLVSGVDVGFAVGVDGDGDVVGVDFVVMRGAQ